MQAKNDEQSRHGHEISIFFDNTHYCIAFSFLSLFLIFSDVSICLLDQLDQLDLSSPDEQSQPIPFFGRGWHHTHLLLTFVGTTMATTGTASDPSILASRRAVYVGGLADEVTPQLLRAAMIPFGNIKSLDIPMDYANGAHKGFGFVEYEDADDAAEAIFNMDGSDLLGRTMKVSLAQLNQLNKLSTTQQAIWSNDEWFQQHVSGEMSKEEQEKINQQQQDMKELQD